MDSGAGRVPLVHPVPASEALPSGNDLASLETVPESIQIERDSVCPPDAELLFRAVDGWS